MREEGKVVVGGNEHKRAKRWAALLFSSSKPKPSELQLRKDALLRRRRRWWWWWCVVGGIFLPRRGHLVTEPTRAPSNRTQETLGAGPRWVAQARDQTPLRHWHALRAAATGGHQGDPGGQAPGGGAARDRGSRAAGGLRRQQQQLRRQGSALSPLHTQTRPGRWTSFSPGSCMGVE